MNRGIVKVDMGVLADLLHLPAGHRIITARQADAFTETVELLVEGPDLPTVAADQKTPWVQLLVTVTETDTMVRERKLSGRFA